MRRVVGAVVVMGTICLGTLLSERMIRVRPPISDSLAVTLPDTFSSSATKAAPVARYRALSSFESNPLRFLSRAPADSLDLLPGIGPVLAARIVEAREARSGFSSWNEVLAVKGIGPRLIARWQSLSTRQ